MSILIKQRRRWMNGALFAALRVIKNSHNMVGFSRTTHSLGQKIMMISFMLYFYVQQLMTFFMVATYYVTIKFFFVGLL